MENFRRKWNPEYLPEAVNRYNQTAEAMREALPKIRAILNGAKVTQSAIGKRDREAIQSIIGQHFTAPRMRAFLDTQYEYTLYLRVDFNSHDTEYGVSYADMTTAIASKHSGDATWTALEAKAPSQTTLDAVEAAIARASQALGVLDAALDAFREAKHEALPFVD
jgi:hypothetical protein